MGTKFHGLTTMNMFVDSWILLFQIIRSTFCITKVNNYIVGILNLWIALPTKKHEIKCPMNKTDFTVIYLSTSKPWYTTIKLFQAEGPEIPARPYDSEARSRIRPCVSTETVRLVESLEFTSHNCRHRR